MAALMGSRVLIGIGAIVMDGALTLKTTSCLRRRQPGTAQGRRLSQRLSLYVGSPARSSPPSHGTRKGSFLNVQRRQITSRLKEKHRIANQAILDK
jgi:carbonic anhydrase/acetyltransferase-like protein (isoleucine patch superfamily)